MLHILINGTYVPKLHVNLNTALAKQCGFLIVCSISKWLTTELTQFQSIIYVKLRILFCYRLYYKVNTKRSTGPSIALDQLAGSHHMRRNLRIKVLCTVNVQANIMILYFNWHLVKPNISLNRPCKGSKQQQSKWHYSEGQSLVMKVRHLFLYP